MTWYDYAYEDNISYCEVDAGAYVIGVTPEITSLNVAQTITVPAELNKFSDFQRDGVFDVLGLNTIDFKNNNLKTISIDVNHNNTGELAKLDVNTLTAFGLKPGIYFDENFSPNILEDLRVSYKNDNDEKEYRVNRGGLIEKKKNADYSTHETLVCCEGARKIWNFQNIEFCDSIGIALANSNVETIIFSGSSCWQAIDEKILQNCKKLKTIILPCVMKNYKWISHLSTEARILVPSSEVNTIKNYWEGEIDVKPGLIQPATTSDGMLNIRVNIPRDFKLDYVTYDAVDPSKDSYISHTQQISSDYAAQTEEREYKLPYNPLIGETRVDFYWRLIDYPYPDDLISWKEPYSDPTYTDSPLFSVRLTNSIEKGGNFYLEDNIAELQFDFSRDIDESIVDYGIFVTPGDIYVSANNEQKVAVGPLPFYSKISIRPYATVKQNGELVKCLGGKITQRPNDYHYSMRDYFNTGGEPDITVKYTPDKADCADVSVAIGKWEGESFVTYGYPHSFVNTTFTIDKSYSGEFSSESGTVSFVDFTPGSEFRIIKMSTQVEYETILGIGRINYNEDYSKMSWGGLIFNVPGITWTTLPTYGASESKAIISAEINLINDPENTGFEWRRYDAPELVPSNKVACPVVGGLMSGRLNNLSANTYYKYRPYYEAIDGTMYYGEWMAFGTADAYVYFEPMVNTYEPTEITETSAVLSGYALGGSDDIIEQGFEYSVAETTDVYKVRAEGERMSALLADLLPGTTYIARAYVTDSKTTTRGNMVVFTTAGEPQDAIEEVAAELEDLQKFDVWTLQGVCVRRGASDLNGLRPGLYIANGRKILVK